jgi:hypothetical protein
LLEEADNPEVHEGQDNQEAVVALVGGRGMDNRAQGTGATDRVLDSQESETVDRDQVMDNQGQGMVAHLQTRQPRTALRLLMQENERVRSRKPPI